MRIAGKWSGRYLRKWCLYSLGGEGEETERERFEMRQERMNVKRQTDDKVNNPGESQSCGMFLLGWASESLNTVLIQYAYCHAFIILTGDKLALMVRGGCTVYKPWTTRTLYWTDYGYDSLLLPRIP